MDCEAAPAAAGMIVVSVSSASAAIRFPAMSAFLSSLPESSRHSARAVALDDFVVIRATGADAVDFLHGQLTQDVAGLGQDARFAGYCSAKGRLMATLAIWRAPRADADGGVCALVRRDIAEALVKRLSMFVLRAKARLALAPTQAAGVWLEASDATALEAAAGGALPRAPWQRADLPSGTWIAAPGADAGLRWWWIAGREPAVDDALGAVLSPGAASRWHADDLAAGLPWVGAATQDLFIPQTVNLDLVGGVSFTKGCYPGQEIVARAHYRGTVKRRMAFGWSPVQEPPPAGSDVYDAREPGSPCGRVIDAATGGDRSAVLFETTFDVLDAGELHIQAPDGPALAPAGLPYPVKRD